MCNIISSVKIIYDVSKMDNSIKTFNTSIGMT